LRLVYSDQYDLSSRNHVFPSIKYCLIKEEPLRGCDVDQPRNLAKSVTVE
jgi:hypothetical protein